MHAIKTVIPNSSAHPPPPSRASSLPPSASDQDRIRDPRVKRGQPRAMPLGQHQQMSVGDLFYPFHVSGQGICSQIVGHPGKTTIRQQTRQDRLGLVNVCRQSRNHRNPDKPDLGDRTCQQANGIRKLRQPNAGQPTRRMSRISQRDQNINIEQAVRHRARSRALARTAGDTGFSPVCMGLNKRPVSGSFSSKSACLRLVTLRPVDLRIGFFDFVTVAMSTN